MENRVMMLQKLTDLSFALAAYKADHHAYPEKLAKLAPTYVKQLPKDYFNESDLHYEKKNDGYLLYSVGPNGKDDGGKSYDDQGTNPEWDDIAVRVPANVKPFSTPPSFPK